MLEDAGMNLGARKMIQYTEDFLRQFSDIKYEVPESIKKSDLYIHAPRPPVHRPRVDRSRSKDGGRNKSFLSANERQELRRRREDDVKKKHEGLKDGFSTPMKSPAKGPQPSATPQKLDGSAEEMQPTSEEETETDVEDITAAALQAAQEQQLVLSMPDPEGPGNANKPEARSLLSHNKKNLTAESDEHRLAQRVKQIVYGKATHGYKCYLRVLPKEKRTKRDPHTPLATQKCSKRSWDGQVRKWRRQLHKYDDLFPVSETGGTLGDDISASDAENPPAACTRQPRSHMPTPVKTPTVSKEERDELARIRKEMMSTPQKELPQSEDED